MPTNQFGQYLRKMQHRTKPGNGFFGQNNIPYPKVYGDNFQGGVYKGHTSVSLASVSVVDILLTTLAVSLGFQLYEVQSEPTLSLLPMDNL